MCDIVGAMIAARAPLIGLFRRAVYRRAPRADTSEHYYTLREVQKLLFAEICVLLCCLKISGMCGWVAGRLVGNKANEFGHLFRLERR